MQSSLSKIIIWLIVAVVVVGGALMWWFFVAAPQTQTPQTTQSNTGGGSAQNSVTGQSQPPTRQLGAPDVEKAYSDLFQKIKAQPVVFASTNGSSTGALGGVYALYASAAAESKSLYPTDTDFSIQVSLTDLDNDGTPEAIVYNNMDGYCGSGGCALDIYKVEKGKWVNIFSTVAGGDAGLSGSSTNGYTDLFLSVHGDIGSQTQVVRYAWDGKTYQQKETVATWDGTTFNTPQ